MVKKEAGDLEQALNLYKKILTIYLDNEMAEDACFRLSPSIHKFDDVFIYSIRPELMAEGGTKC
jgi:hypothetical protein